jgi:hypothetical protein
MASRDANAREHKDYHAMVTHAAYLASVNRGECFHVYFDGEALFVLHSAEEPPPNATILCIAQHHTSGVVQVRFSGAWSEFRNFPHGASSLLDRQALCPCCRGGRRSSPAGRSSWSYRF